ncbi:transcription initiation factor TFIID subunit 5-like [Watersipora subatra]|uniref:transcription initiation factor TFIID subunit 5-like n=1 Tax=Watersipora subatra TaxID=2589382 RepID=UPI00355B0E5B
MDRDIFNADVPTVVADGGGDTPLNKLDLSTVLEFLQKNNFKNAASALLSESPASAAADESATDPTNKSLESYKSTDAPFAFEEHYENYLKFVDSTLEAYKDELRLLIYPTYVHMYLNLVYNNHEHSALAFYEAFIDNQEESNMEILEKMRNIRKREHMQTDPLMNTLRSNKHVVKMCREIFTHMKRHLQENGMVTMLNVIDEHLHIETYDGAPRNQQQTQAVTGSLLGESKKDANKGKVLYGLLKEPEINIPIDDDDETEDGDKPKKKKNRRDTPSLKKSKNDPNSPQITRIPLPEMRDMDKLERIQMYKDSLKRVTVGPNSLPSICFYTFLNTFSGVSCCAFTDDSSMIAAGLEDSQVKVWTLSQQTLRSMKSGEELNNLDKEADDILERMMDDSTASESKSLIGHSGPVYGVSFSPDRHSLLSCSEDGTIRLWSLLTWTNLVCYKGHNYPVFDVQFSNHGFYFVSAGHDRLARLWSTDHFQPMRLLAGHYSDVDCVKYHPNSNYIATGSSDRVVRLFDVLSGNCMRTYTGHKAPILALTFSVCGRYLASAGADRNVHIWDLSNGTLVSKLSEHTDAVISLAFSREGAVLASGGMDNRICLWDMQPIYEERSPPDANTQQLAELIEISCLASFPTKATPVMSLHFTRRNLLLAAGSFRQTA